MQQFIEAAIIAYCKKYFNLRLPIVVKIRKGKKFNSQFAAMWNGEENHHLIEFGYDQFANDGCEFLLETVLHELCHAEQHESGLETEHNKQFFNRLSALLKMEGLPKIDKEYKLIVKGT